MVDDMDRMDVRGTLPVIDGAKVHKMISSLRLRPVSVVCGVKGDRSIIFTNVRSFQINLGHFVEVA